MTIKQKTMPKEKQLDQWKLNYLIKTFGRRTHNKDTESFILNMIWNKLSQHGCEIQPITQQIVFVKGKKHYFLDLYFPALKIAIECDEKHHKQQVTKDEIRVRDVLSTLHAENKELTPWKKLAVQNVSDALDASLYRVKAYETSYEKICDDVDKIVEIIIKRWKFLEAQKEGSTKWLIPQEQINALHNETEAELVAGSSPDFNCIIDGYNLFRKTPLTNKRHKCYFRLGNLDYMMWFAQAPKVNKDNNNEENTKEESTNKDGWVNVIQGDFSILEMNLNNNKEATVPPKDNLPRLTFIKDKNELGRSVYRFVGVYQFSRLTKEGREYKRIDQGVRWRRGENDEFPTKMEFFTP